MSDPRMNDFSDVLPPMMVKELRQGLRSKVFYFAFIVTLIGLFAAVIPAENDRGFSGLGFYLSTGLALVVIFPFRGLSAFSSEDSDEALDLVRISNLGTWNIVVGKWAAISCPALLFATIALPFIVVRYFTGGASIFLDLLWLVIFLVGNLFVTAVAMLTSIARAGPVRIVGSLVAFLTALAGIWAMRNLYTFSMQNDWKTLWGVYAFYFFTLPVLLYYVLLTISNLLSAPWENFATTARVAVTFFLLVLFGIAFFDFGLDSKPLFFTSLSLTAFAFCATLAEPTVQSSRSLGGFARSRSAFRAARYLFEPGWHSGILFLVLTCGITSATRLLDDSLFVAPEQLLHFGALFLSLLVSLAIPGALSFPTARFFGGRAPAFLALLSLSLLQLLLFLYITDLINLNPYSTSALALGCLLPPFLLSLAPGIAIHELSSGEPALSMLIMTTSGIHLTLLVVYLRRALKKPFTDSASLFSHAKPS